MLGYIFVLLFFLVNKFFYIFLKVPPDAILGIKGWMIGQLTQH